LEKLRKDVARLRVDAGKVADEICWYPMAIAAGISVTITTITILIVGSWVRADFLL
jgi:hypothetical protein